MLWHIVRGIFAWMGVATLAGLPIFFVATNAFNDWSWQALSRLHDGDLYRDFTLYAGVLIGVGAFDAFDAAVHHPKRDHKLVFAARTLGSILLVLAAAFYLAYGVVLYALGSSGSASVPRLPLFLFLIGLVGSLLARLSLEAIYLARASETVR